jgi:hypothetical protein
MLAADNGTYSSYAQGAPRISVFCAGPLDQNASIKGGPYSEGVYRARKDEGCFGYVQVKDGRSRIDIRYSGRNYLNEEKIACAFSVPVN